MEWNMKHNETPIRERQVETFSPNETSNIIKHQLGNDKQRPFHLEAIGNGTAYT